MQSASTAQKKKIVIESCVISSPKTVGQGFSKLTTYMITTKLSPHNEPENNNNNTFNTSSFNPKEENDINPPTTSTTISQSSHPQPIKTSSSGTYSVVYERRRYKDFDKFYKSIKTLIHSPTFSNVKPPKLPSKTVLNRFDKKVIENRSMMFQEIIDYCSKNPIIANLKQFKHLIGIDNPSMQDKEIVVMPLSPNLIGIHSPLNDKIFQQMSSSSQQNKSNFRKSIATFSAFTSNTTFADDAKNRRTTMRFTGGLVPLEISSGKLPQKSAPKKPRALPDLPEPSTNNSSEHSQSSGSGAAIFRMDTLYESSDSECTDEEIEESEKVQQQENETHNDKTGEPMQEQSNETQDQPANKRVSSESSTNEEDQTHKNDDLLNANENLQDFNEIMKLLSTASPETENDES